MRLNAYGQSCSPITTRTKKYGEGEAVSDDIVTRLREWHTAWNWYLPDEAADEIERLRAECVAHRRAADIAANSIYSNVAEIVRPQNMKDALETYEEQRKNHGQ